MKIVMKGRGIAVVVIFFLAAVIASFWYDDHTVGNTEFTKWIFLFTGTAGLALSFGTTNKENFTKHSVLFIPIIFWGVGFLILGIYQFF